MQSGYNNMLLFLGKWNDKLGQLSEMSLTRQTEAA